MYPLSKVEEGYYGIQVNRYTFIFASEKSGICILCERYHFQEHISHEGQIFNII